jgi:hypothetical protein
VNIPNWITSIATAITALGVMLAWRQIAQAKEQAISTFEDALNAQYREIAQRLPIEALLGEPLEENARREFLKEFYSYIDFTNEEVFLRRRGRVSRETWNDWLEGIKWNLTRPAFAAAWTEIKQRSPESFNDLRRLEKESFCSDPAKWSK